MPAPNTVTPDTLMRLIGTPRCPVIVDVRTEEDFAADPRLLPTTQRRPAIDDAIWAGTITGTAVVVCQKRLQLSHGAAAWLRYGGTSAEVLYGGFRGWRDAGLPLVPQATIPPRDDRGRTVWVTRARSKIDRIACPWLVRRSVDPAAVFLFVAPSEVGVVADRSGATPFDVEGVTWSHRGVSCTFDAMVEELGLAIEPLLRLAIVRRADTARLDLAPEAAGLLAISLGLSRIYADDLEQLAAGLALYDAFYRWCRDAGDETHNSPTNKGPAR